MDRSSKHQPKEAGNKSSQNPLDPKILRAQSRSHLDKKNQREQQAALSYGQPLPGYPEMGSYYLMNPMGMMPWPMGYPAPGAQPIPGAEAHSGQLPNPAASVPVFQTPAVQMPPQGAYASMPFPVYGYPHQMPLVPLQPVQLPPGGFYPGHPHQQNYPMHRPDANPMSMLASTIKRKFFGLTYPALGEEAPKPKMLSVDSWRKIRQAQKVLKHNWHSEMRLKENPSDIERRMNGNTLDDLFPSNAVKSAPMPQAPKSNAASEKNVLLDSAAKADNDPLRIVQMDLLQAQNPISVQADFTYEFQEQVHVPLAQDAATYVINTDESRIAVEPVERTSIIESIQTEPISTIAIDNDESGDEQLIATASFVDATASSQPVEVETSINTSENTIVANAEGSHEISAAEIAINMDTSAPKQRQQSVAVKPSSHKPASRIDNPVAVAVSHLEGLSDIFPESPIEDFSPGWKPYSSKPGSAPKNRRQAKSAIPVSLSRLNADQDPAETAQASEASIWSKMVTAVQKRLTAPEETMPQPSAISKKSANPISEIQSLGRNEFAELKENMTAIREEAVEEGANTYDMWRQYKTLEGKMYQQKKMIQDLLSVQQSFDDTKLDYCYFPQFEEIEADAEFEADPAILEMKEDLQLGSFSEIQAAVESRHPSQNEIETVSPEAAPIQTRHVDVEVLHPNSNRVNRVLGEIKDSTADAGINSIVRQSRPLSSYAMGKSSLDQAVKEALVYTPTNQEVIAAAMNHHMMGMQGGRSYADLHQQSMAMAGQDPSGVYSMETTVRVEFKKPGCDPVTMLHRVQEDFTVQSMLQSNRMLSNSISSLADEYFRHSEHHDEPSVPVSAETAVES